MGNVIEFLARLGKDASLRHASDDVLVALVAGEPAMDVAVSEALASRDPEALRTVLGQAIFFGSQMNPLREEPEEEEEEGDENDEDGEDGEKLLRPHSSNSSPSGLRH